MRLSTLGRYALRAMVDLALHQDQGPVLRKDIVARQEISSNYLAHLFAKLKQARLINSMMGPGGGYVLARNADAISAGDVLRAVDEVLEPVFCVAPAPEVACPRVDSCVTHLLWRRLSQHIVELLNSVTLAELCTQSRLLVEKEPLDRTCGNTAMGGCRVERRVGQFSNCVFMDGAGI